VAFLWRFAAGEFSGQRHARQTFIVFKDEVETLPEVFFKQIFRR
jgi:hypothetical protein